MKNPAIRLALDLHPVGPREGNAAAAELWLGLNIASGYDTEPDPGDARRMVDALMPGAFLPDPVSFRLYLLGTAPDEIPALAADPAGAGAFAAKLAAGVLGLAATLATQGKLDMGWAGEPVESGDEEIADGTLKAWPWLGLSTGMATLPPELAQDIRGRCYVKVDGAQLRAALAADPDARIVLAPEQVEDANNGKTFDLASCDPETGDRCTLTYGARDDLGKDLPDLLAYAIPLPLSALFASAAGSPLAGYWLSVTDSRDDSVADIDQILARNADPAALAMLPSAELLGTALGFAAPSKRRPLPAHIAAIRAGARLWAEKLAEDARAERVRSFVDAVLSHDDLETKALARHAQERIATEWADFLAEAETTIRDGRIPIADDLKLGVDDHFTLDEAVLAEGLETPVWQFLRIDAQPGPSLPGEGIDFLIGEHGRRLVSASAEPAQGRTDFNEMAEFGLLVRRASVSTDLKTMPWRIVTAGVPLLDPDKLLNELPWGSPATLGLDLHDRIAVRGLALAFKDGVLRNDDAYFGQMMTGPRALSFVHDTRGQSDEPAGAPVDATELHYVSPALTTVAGSEHARAPVLRYGDSYELAALLIDRVGGLPAALTGGKPWIADLSRLATATPPLAKVIAFLRRVPLGDLNVKPSGLAGWPKPPAGVQLRAVEWHAAAGTSRAAPPVLLFGNLADPPPGVGNVTSHAFTVEPPSIDEHTLQRWAMPPTTATAATAQAAILAFKDEYVRIMDIRNALQVAGSSRQEADMLPHDPAAPDVLLERREFDRDGLAVATDQLRVAFVADGVFRKAPLEIEVSLAATKPLSAAVSKATVAAPPEGHFAELKISLLCPASDHVRFDGAALPYGKLATYADPVTKQTYRVHPGETILLETICEDLPDTNDLFEGFSLTPDSAGRILVGFDGKAANMAFVDSYSIDRQRWVWRNLPQVLEHGPADTAERRLTSGLPLALHDADGAVRDADQVTLKFDAIAELDHGFVSRTRAGGSWPRAANGAPVPNTELLIDDRDAQSAADYLRYSLTITSRYAPLLPEGKRSVTATPRVRDFAFGKTQGNWRRVAASYRGREALRVPNILAVLPMTASPRQQPDGLVASEGTTPFLVIVDEVAFREFGHGEGLRAELALEDREIGDPPERLIRYGPLPTKHVTANPDSKAYTDAEIEPGNAKYASLRLDVFGPFGYSLERSGNEALSNASAYVVYLPKGRKIGPEWSVAVRFRRIMHDLRSGAPVALRHGPPSSNYLLYTLSDSRLLVAPKPEGSAARLIIATTAGIPTGAVAFEHAEVQLSPYLRDGKLPHPLVAANYRYVLLVGRKVRDGGRAVDAFLPEQAFWIDDPTRIRHLDASVPERLITGANLQGQILEIEVNEPGSTVAGGLEAVARDLISLFDGLLRKPDVMEGRDALGRILRISDPFEVSAR